MAPILDVVDTVAITAEAAAAAILTLPSDEVGFSMKNPQRQPDRSVTICRGCRAGIVPTPFSQYEKQTVCCPSSGEG